MGASTESSRLTIGEENDNASTHGDVIVLSGKYGIAHDANFHQFYNGNVGIGTGFSAASPLSVGGGMTIGSSYTSVAAPANGLIISGSVGIGVTNPGAALETSGIIKSFRVNTTENGTSFPGYSFTGDVTSGMAGGSGAIGLVTSSKVRLNIQSTGDCVIGTGYNATTSSSDFSGGPYIRTSQGWIYVNTTAYQIFPSSYLPNGSSDYAFGTITVYVTSRTGNYAMIERNFNYTNGVASVGGINNTYYVGYGNALTLGTSGNAIVVQSIVSGSNYVSWMVQGAC